MNDLLAKYDRPVPRYTSYPTAPNFRSDVGPETYHRWLGELDQSGDGSLYLHVPFCRELCWYCGCHTWVISRKRAVEGFPDLLRAELALVATAIPRRLRLKHIHWGGGTPTAIGADAVRNVSAHIRRVFDVAADAEIAMEIDPRVLDEAMIEALKEAGTTRASLGVQDFDEIVQRAVNRVQPYEMTARAVEHLRRAGIDAINLDLMYGLPFQTVDSVVASVDLAVALAPDRLALFGYAHVPWMKRHQRLLDERQLPDGAERWAQFSAATARLRDHGYVWVGLDHFAKPDDALASAMRRGAMRRNFQGHTTDTADILIGVGPSAIGSLPQGYVQNVADLGPWRRAIGDGTFATCRGVALERDDRMRRHVIERIMCDLAVDLGEAAAAFEEPCTVFDSERIRLAALAADGLIEIDGNRVALTEEGRPLMRIVASVFDRYFPATANRHARSV
ncbi:MAG: oxygen-independent coproporphyrinogen III oxidase [Alphaproteobacteria bacterium]